MDATKIEVPVERTADDDVLSGPRKLSHSAARREQLIYWSGKSIPERLAAMTELTRRAYRMQGIDIDELKTDLTPRRVRRRQG